MADDVNVFSRVISGGVIDVTAGSGRYNISNENGTPTDIIDTIIGAAHPHVYEFRVATPGQYWTINHNPAGAIRLIEGFNFATQYPDDRILLMAGEVGSYVIEFLRLRIPNV